jgi:hypothetical protein
MAAAMIGRAKLYCFSRQFSPLLRPVPRFMRAWQQLGDFAATVGVSLGG